MMADNQKRMKRDHYIKLIYKSLKGEAVADEESQLDAWLAESEENHQLKTKVEQEWKQSENYEPALEIDVKADFQQLKQRIKTQKQQENSETKVVKMNTRRQWLAIAAAIAVFVVAGWGFFGVETSPNNKIAQAEQGERLLVNLSDGSKIWLSENSRLIYPESFSSHQRVVELEGEGFFDIKRDKRSPFTVETKWANVSVLGTSFTLNAYEETQKVTLEVKTGKVKLEDKSSTKSLILTVGESGELDVKNHSIGKTNTTHSKALRFKDQSLENVISAIAQQYKVDVSIDQKTMKTCVFTGRLQEQDVESALQNIADAFQMTVEQQAVNVFVLKGGTCEGQ